MVDADRGLFGEEVSCMVGDGEGMEEEKRDVEVPGSLELLDRSLFTMD